MAAIETEDEYRYSSQEAQRIEKNLKTQERELHKSGKTAIEIKTLLDPLRSFLAGIKEEITAYETQQRNAVMEQKKC